MKVSKTLRAIAAGLVCLMVMNTLAAEWQWSVPLGNGRAFLWIPPKCRQVRAAEEAKAAKVKKPKVTREKHADEML